METIITKYLGPTNFRGARIIATSETGKRITREYNYGMGTVRNHSVVAAELARKLGMTGELLAGSTKTGYVFVSPVGDWFHISDGRPQAISGVRFE